MKNELWEQLTKYYKDKFGIEPELVSLMSDIDVLKLCCSGSSNESISKFLNIDVSDVSNTVDKYFGFPGWNEDLIFSPYKIFIHILNWSVSHTETFRELFVKELYNQVPISPDLINDTNVDLLLHMCHSMYYYERELNEKWI